MKDYHETMKAQHNELNKRVDSTRGAFVMDVDELPKEKHPKFVRLDNLRTKDTTIMGKKI